MLFFVVFPLSSLGCGVVQCKGAVEFLGQADPKRAALALALAFDKSVLKQLLDVVVSATAAQVHELRLQDAFFQRHGGQGPQAGGAEIHRHQLLNLVQRN